MVPSDKNMAEANAAVDDDSEIDRIMKEIEDLEKKMDSGSDDASESEDAKVVALRPGSSNGATLESADSSLHAIEDSTSEEGTLAETDAVPVSDKPLKKEESSLEDRMSSIGGRESHGENGLSLKISGCAEVSLEFTRSNITVTLSCNEDGLCISTDQGAEFRIPFKRVA